MTREQRTVAVSILTVFLLALSNFMQKGSFIFTFPINEILFLVVSLYLAYFNAKQNVKAYVLLLAMAIAALFSEQYNLEFVLNTAQLTFYDSYGIGDWFKIAAQLFLLGLSFLFLRQTGWKHSWLWFSALILCEVLAIALELPVLMHLPLLLITILMGSCKSRQDYGYESIYYLCLLLNVLQLSKAFTLSSSL